MKTTNDKKAKGFTCEYCGFNHGISICCTGFKKAIENLFNEKRQLNKQEAIKMRYSKR